MARDLPSLNALRAFEAVARLESMSRAAMELHVTHGAVSRHVRALESDLGVALFGRQGRGLILTEAGRQLHTGVANAFAQMRASCERLRHDATKAALVLGCSGSVLARWVIPRLQRMNHDLAGLTLHFSAIEGQPSADLSGMDAVLLLAEPPWSPDWQVEVLAAERIGPVLSPRHPHIVALRKADTAALCREPLLHTISRPQAWPNWARAQRIAGSRLHYGQAFEHLYYLLEAAVAGLGVAIAPQALVTEDLAAGRLLAPWGFRVTRANWVLVYPKRANDQRLQTLASWLRGELKDI